MLFFIFLALTIGFIWLSIAANRYYDKAEAYHWRNDYEKYEKCKKNILYSIAATDCFVTGIPAVICGLVTFIMIIVLIVTHCGTAARAASLIEQQKALEYKICTDYARDEFGLHNKELIDDVQEWNEDVAYAKVAEDDLWIGVFYPNIINKYGLHTIDLK